MLLQALLLHVRASQPCLTSPAMAAGNGQFALPVKAEVRSERWCGSASRSERAVRINVMRPALDALPGSGGRPVPATTVGHCGVVVLEVDETGFHTECSTVCSIHPSPPPPPPHPPPPERLSQRLAFTLTSTLTLMARSLPLATPRLTSTLTSTLTFTAHRSPLTFHPLRCDRGRC